MVTNGEQLSRRPEGLRQPACGSSPGRERRAGAGGRLAHRPRDPEEHIPAGHRASATSEATARGGQRSHTKARVDDHAVRPALDGTPYAKAANAQGRRTESEGVAMLSRLRSTLTFSNTVAMVALFIALGGSSYAALQVGSEQIADNSVRSKDLRNNDIRGRDIHTGAVRSADLRNNDIRGRDIPGRRAKRRTAQQRHPQRGHPHRRIAGGDVAADTLTGANLLESSLATVPSAANAATLDGKSATAFLAADRLVTTGFEELSIGETRTIAPAARSPGARRARTPPATASSPSRSSRRRPMPSRPALTPPPGAVRSVLAHRSRSSRPRRPLPSTASGSRRPRWRRAAQLPSDWVSSRSMWPAPTAA